MRCDVVWGGLQWKGIAFALAGYYTQGDAGACAKKVKVYIAVIALYSYNM